MAKLAIKGHATRGNEVIKILEMLGGSNKYHINITECNLLYTIREWDDVIIGTYPNSNISHIYTLEEFLEKFPYKVGDRVYNIIHNENQTITKLVWDFQENEVVYQTNNNEYVYVNFLQPYKKETMEKEISGAIVDRFICLEGYDFYDDKGNIIDTKEITMKKKKPKYPTTYDECCEVLHSDTAFYVDTHLYSDKLGILYKLLICRNAYWKIAGDWKPNFANQEKKFVIANYYGELCTCKALNRNRVLVFPTEEMRDAFYENFKDLIEECKELL
jgi:hypothetical protein